MSEERDEEYAVQIGPASLKVRQSIPYGSQIGCSLAILICRWVGAAELAGRLVEMQAAHGDAFIATQQATIITSLTQSTRAMQELEETTASTAIAEAAWHEIADEATAQSQAEASSSQLISEDAANQPMVQAAETLFGAGVSVSVQPADFHGAIRRVRSVEGTSEARPRQSEPDLR